MKKITVLFFFIISQNQTYIINALNTNNENSNKNPLTINAFTKLNICGFCRVIYKKDKNYSMTIKADERILKYIETDTSEGVLKIKINTNSLKNHKIKTYNIKGTNNCSPILNSNSFDGTMTFIEIPGSIYFIEGHSIYKTNANNIEDLVTINITSPYIERIELNGKIVFVFSNQNDKQSKLDIFLQGLSSLEAENISSKKINITLKDSSSVNINSLNTDHLKIDAQNKPVLAIKDCIITKSTYFNLENYATAVLQTLKTDYLNIKERENTNINLDNLKVNNVDINLVDESSVLIKKIFAKKFNCTLNDHSWNKILDGNISMATIILKHKSKLNIQNVEIKDAHINAKGKGNALINVLNKLSIDISKSFNLNYIRKPKTVSIAKKVVSKLKKTTKKTLKKLRKRKKNKKIE